MTKAAAAGADGYHLGRSMKPGVWRGGGGRTSAYESKLNESSLRPEWRYLRWKGTRHGKMFTIFTFCLPRARLVIPSSICGVARAFAFTHQCTVNCKDIIQGTWGLTGPLSYTKAPGDQAAQHVAL